MKAMENVHAGTFWINDPLTDNDAGPFGGMRRSGLGRELGSEGIEDFRDSKHVHMDYVVGRSRTGTPTATTGRGTRTMRVLARPRQGLSA